MTYFCKSAFGPKYIFYKQLQFCGSLFGWVQDFLDFAIFGPPIKVMERGNYCYCTDPGQNWTRTTPQQLFLAEATPRPGSYIHQGSPTIFVADRTPLCPENLRKVLLVSCCRFWPPAATCCLDVWPWCWRPGGESAFLPEEVSADG